jgi:hypothetical protein
VHIDVAIVSLLSFVVVVLMVSAFIRGTSTRARMRREAAVTRERLRRR